MEVDWLRLYVLAVSGIGDCRWLRWLWFLISDPVAPLTATGVAVAVCMTAAAVVIDGDSIDLVREGECEGYLTLLISPL